MKHPKKRIATSSLCVGLLVLCVFPAMAGSAIGTVTQVNGPLLLKRADGTIKALALNSFVEQGDTLVAEKNTYAKLKFVDDSEVTLKPNTQLKIEVLVFNTAATNNLDTVLSISKGAVQIKTGAAARSTLESIRLVMPSLLDPVASITLNRKAGTNFIAQFVGASAESLLARYGSKQLTARYPAVQLAAAESGYRTDAPTIGWPTNWTAPRLLAQLPPSIPGGLPPGLYVNVIDGEIYMRNTGGTRNFSGGQFGYTPNINRPPILLPTNPGIQFTPPPSFSSSTAPTNASSSSKPETVNCEVR